MKMTSRALSQLLAGRMWESWKYDFWERMGDLMFLKIEKGSDLRGLEAVIFTPTERTLSIVCEELKGHS